MCICAEQGGNDMVVLNKIYTKTGDAGETALGNGARVAKHALRVTAYGGPIWHRMPQLNTRPCGWPRNR